MLSVATILMDKMYLIGTDPMNIMHTVVTVPMDKMHSARTLMFFLIYFHIHIH